MFLFLSLHVSTHLCDVAPFFLYQCGNAWQLFPVSQGPVRMDPSHFCTHQLLNKLKKSKAMVSWVWGGIGRGGRGRANSKGGRRGAANHAPVRGVAREPRLERLRVCQAVNGSARGAVNEARV